MDLLLFPNLIYKLRGQWFSLAREAADAFKNHVFEVSSGMEKCFEIFYFQWKIMVLLLNSNYKWHSSYKTNLLVEWNAGNFSKNRWQRNTINCDDYWKIAID